MKYGEDLYIYEHENKEELFNENNASCHTTINYNLDKDVVVAEALTALPDLTEYTKIEN